MNITIGTLLVMHLACVLFGGLWWIMIHGWDEVWAKVRAEWHSAVVWQTIMLIVCLTSGWIFSAGISNPDLLQVSIRLLPVLCGALGTFALRWVLKARDIVVVGPASLCGHYVKWEVTLPFRYWKALKDPDAMIRGALQCQVGKTMIDACGDVTFRVFCRKDARAPAARAIDQLVECMRLQATAPILRAVS